jgi:hypothetical protein
MQIQDRAGELVGGEGSGVLDERVLMCLTMCLLLLAAAAGQAENMQADMPPNEYYELFKPDYSLFIKKDTAMRNENTSTKLDKVRVGVGSWLGTCRSCIGELG